MFKLSGKDACVRMLLVHVHMPCVCRWKTAEQNVCVAGSKTRRYMRRS